METPKEKTKAAEEKTKAAEELKNLRAMRKA